MKGPMPLLLLLFFLIATLSLSGSAWSAPAFVDSQSFACTSSPCSDFRVTYIGATQGSLLVLSARASSAGTLTVTSPGLTWTRDIRESTLGWVLEVWSAPNVSSGNHTITVDSTTDPTYNRVLVTEFSGVATGSPTHKTASATGGSGQPTNAGSVTTTIDGCLLYAVAASDPDGLTWVAGSNYTLRTPCTVDGEPDQKLCAESRGPVSIGTYSNGFSTTINGWAAGLVAYAPAEGTPTVPHPPDAHR
jgi:hypothetical protein